jgi:hypothetical protein
MSKDIRRPLPNRIHLDIPVDNRDPALFDVALSAQRLHTLRQKGDGEFGYCGFEDGGEEAEEVSLLGCCSEGFDFAEEGG